VIAATLGSKTLANNLAVLLKETLIFLAATFISFITSCLLMIVQWSVRNITDVTVGPGGRSLDNGIPMCVS